jgi:hypothetical protein
MCRLTRLVTITVDAEAEFGIIKESTINTGPSTGAALTFRAGAAALCAVVPLNFPDGRHRD